MPANGLDYTPIVKDVMGLFTVGVEMATSNKEVADATGHTESAVGHVKKFLQAVGAVTTRFDWRKGGGGKVAYWQTHMSAEDALELLDRYGLDFSPTAMDKISRLAMGAGHGGAFPNVLDKLEPVKPAPAKAPAKVEPAYPRSPTAAIEDHPGLRTIVEQPMTRDQAIHKLLGDKAFSETERAIVGAWAAGSIVSELSDRFGVAPSDVLALIKRVEQSLEVIKTAEAVRAAPLPVKDDRAVPMDPGDPHGHDLQCEDKRRVPDGSECKCRERRLAFSGLSRAQAEGAAMAEAEASVALDSAEGGAVTMKEPSQSIKDKIWAILKAHADDRGIVQRLSYFQLQQEVGNNQGLHSIFHVLRSLQRDGVVRFTNLPTKLATAEQARKTYVIMTVVDRTKDKLPPAPPMRPTTPPLAPASHPRSGPVRVVTPPTNPTTTNGKPMTEPPKPVYVPYLSPAGPLPPTPVADEIIARSAKLEVAYEALVAAGEDAMAEQIRSKLNTTLTPAERELLEIVKWAKATAASPAFTDPRADSSAARHA